MSDQTWEEWLQELKDKARDIYGIPATDIEDAIDLDLARESYEMGLSPSSELREQIRW